MYSKKCLRVHVKLWLLYPLFRSQDLLKRHIYMHCCFLKQTFSFQQQKYLSLQQLYTHSAEQDLKSPRESKCSLSYDQKLIVS